MDETNEITPTTQTPTSESAQPQQFWLLGIPLAFAIGLLIGYLLWGLPTSAGDSTSPAAAAVAGEVQPPGNQEDIRLPVDADDDPFLGPENAPIEIIEFGDYNCGYCLKFHSETFEKLLNSYNGQIKFVYRDFPILSQTSFDAALAANCALEQNRFWEYHDLLLSGNKVLSNATFLDYAEDLNLEMESFQTCLADQKYAQEVAADIQFIADLGARGTPVFFINGLPIMGAAPIETFIDIIESELAN